MAVLTAQALFDPRLPSSFRPLLEDLRHFLELVDRTESMAKGEAPELAARAELVEIHARLTDGSLALGEPDVLSDLSDRDAARLFARSMFFLLHLKEAVTGGERVLDTAGSRTLQIHEADFYTVPGSTAEVRRRLRDGLGLSDADLDAVEAEVDVDLDDARLKKALVAALRDEFGLRIESPDLANRAQALFKFCFPESPLVSGEVHLLLTGTAVFFCIPSVDGELASPRYAALPPAAQQVVRSFLQGVSAFSVNWYRRFPAVGNFEPSRLDGATVEGLAARAGMDATSIRREIDRMVTVLPLEDVDKFIVHDVWGHGWEASMLRFDDAYREMAEYAAPLSWNQAARGDLTLGSCFAIHPDQVVFHKERFHAFARELLAQRLPVSLSGVLAEMMADVVEYGFVAAHPDRADTMPSSSFFQRMPTKLDLTLDDVRFFFELATAPLRSGLGEVVARTLAARGATPSDAQRASGEVEAAWKDLESDELGARLVWRDDPGDALHVNAFTRVALNFLAIHRAIVEAYRRIDASPPGALPARSYEDLLLIGASVFFEADRARNLWRLDEYLSLRFIPLCRKVRIGP